MPTVQNIDAAATPRPARRAKPKPEHCAHCHREFTPGDYGPYCSRHCVEEAMRCNLPKNVKHPKPERM